MSVFHGVKMSLHIMPLELMKYNVAIYFINTLFILVTVLRFVILIAQPKYSSLTFTWKERQKLPQSAINFDFYAMIYMFITYSTYWDKHIWNSTNACKQISLICGDQLPQCNHWNSEPL